jgi:hypothetical protein
VKLDGGWQCLSALTGRGLPEMGFNPPDLNAQFNIADVAEKVHLLAKKKLDGRSVHHIRVETTAERYITQLASMLGATGELADVLASLREGSVSLDLYVDNDHLIRQLGISMKLMADGEQLDIFQTATISDHNKPFAFPLQPPYPSCTPGRRA